MGRMKNCWMLNWGYIQRTRCSRVLKNWLLYVPPVLWTCFQWSQLYSDISSNRFCHKGQVLIGSAAAGGPIICYSKLDHSSDTPLLPARSFNSLYSSPEGRRRSPALSLCCIHPSQETAKKPQENLVLTLRGLASSTVRCSYGSNTVD